MVIESNICILDILVNISVSEQLHEKTNNLGFRPGLTETGLYNHRRRFWIKKDEEFLYYPCSKNKGANQLRSYCEADLRLCFRICSLLVFLCSGSNCIHVINVLK